MMTTARVYARAVRFYLFGFTFNGLPRTCPTWASALMSSWCIETAEVLQGHARGS